MKYDIVASSHFELFNKGYHGQKHGSVYHKNGIVKSITMTDGNYLNDTTNIFKIWFSIPGGWKNGIPIADQTLQTNAGRAIENTKHNGTSFSLYIKTTNGFIYMGEYYFADSIETSYEDGFKQIQFTLSPSNFCLLETNISWTKSTLKACVFISGKDKRFTLNELITCRMDDIIYETGTTSKNYKAVLRRTLQELRDLGFITFVNNNGLYELNNFGIDRAIKVYDTRKVKMCYDVIENDDINNAIVTTTSAHNQELEHNQNFLFKFC